MSDALVARLEAARIECEARMAELCPPGARGAEIPRAWFEYSSIERKLRPLVSHAAQAAREPSA